MEKAGDVAEQIRSIQSKQQRSLEVGSEKLVRERKRIRKRSESLKKPRNRQLDKERMLASLREMSKDMDSLEKGFARMQERDTLISELLEERRDLLLRDCFELKKIIDARRLFEDVERVRSLDEPIGGRQLGSILPNWVPS